MAFCSVGRGVLCAAILVIVGSGRSYASLGDIYVNDLPYNEITRVESTGKYTVVARTVGFSRGIAVDLAGSFYYTDFHGLTKVASDGTTTVLLTSQNAGPLVFDKAGNLYEGDDGNDGIYQVSASGAVTKFAATTLGQITALAFDSLGNLYALDQNTGQIDKISPGGVVAPFGSVGHPGNAVGLAIDNDGNLFVSVITGNSTIIEELSPSDVEHQFASTIDQSYGLAFDGSGNLFAANYTDSQLRIFSPAGALINSVLVPGPYSLAFDFSGSIPEPGSIALLGVGFAAYIAVRRGGRGGYWRKL